MKRKFIKGQLIYNFNDPTKEIFLIKKGQVKIYYSKEVEIGQNFHSTMLVKGLKQKTMDLELCSAGSGMIFGDVEILSN